LTSFATVRDPVKDHLLTPQNSALIIIDSQPVQESSVASRSKRELVANITALALRTFCKAKHARILLQRDRGQPSQSTAAAAGDQPVEQQRTRTPKGLSPLRLLGVLSMPTTSAA
jgi:hypothetical protein